MYPPLLFIRAFDRLNIHYVLPVLPVIILHDEGYRRTCRITMAYPADDLGGILLDLHPPTSSVPLLASGKFKIKRIEIQIEIARHAFNNRRKLRAMRLSRCQIPQTHDAFPL
ncbi:hypothetical protein D3C77_516310 [compost metagenome]